MQVSLNHILFTTIHFDVLKVSCKEYTSPLASSHWLHYESLGLLARELVLEVRGLIGQDPRLRKEVILALKVSLHTFQVPAEIVFVR